MYTYLYKPVSIWGRMHDYCGIFYTYGPYVDFYTETTAGTALAYIRVRYCVYTVCDDEQTKEKYFNKLTGKNARESVF